VTAFCIKVRRSTQEQVDTYHVAEAYPQGRVDKIVMCGQSPAISP
jgi:hypothetical protein